MPLVVIGGGAAGFFAAIRAREANPRREVTLLEAHSRPLGKVKISGGGRCNVTHACFDVDRLVAHYPRGGAALRGVFHRFGPRDTVAWFERHGVRLKTEGDGRMFPVTDDSQTVIDCLLAAAQRAGVTVVLRNKVEAVRVTRAGFEVGDVQAARVVLASGGVSADFSLAPGHAIVAPVPSLFTFKVKDERIDGLAGVSVPHVSGRLQCDGQKDGPKQHGPLLITHWGLSGPVILRLSAWDARPLHACGYRARLLLDLLPNTPLDDVRAALASRRNERRHVDNDPAVELPRRLWQRLVRASGMAGDRAWAEASRAALNRLADMLKRAEFEVCGKGPFKEEFVTAGGIALRDVDMRTMQSRATPGLFFAGEVLDVDALTGGFNFQNAWSTGWVAGQHAAT